MVFTLLDAIDSDKKIAISPRLDKTFKFMLSKDIPLSEAHTIFASCYVLSRPLIGNVLSTKTEAIDQYYNIDCGYVIVDFDKVTSIHSIVRYFKNNEFSINLFKSRKNAKAVIEVGFQTTRDNIVAFLNLISEHLSSVCEVDYSSTYSASHQAPTKKEECLLYQEGKYKPSQNDINPFKNVIKYEPIQYTNLDAKWFFDHFMSHYGMVHKQRRNSNGTIQCSLPDEVKSKYSYYWDEKIPWLLIHPNKNKTISIFNEYTKTQEGREFLRQQSLNKFKDNFDLLANLTLNERYFPASSQQIIDCISKEYDVLLVKGIMGSGKSNIIGLIDGPKVLYISVRRSLAQDIKLKYDTKYYEDMKGYLPGDKLVVQIDSLYKVPLNNFHTVVIDEFESLCVYTQSNLLESPNFIANMRQLKTVFETKKLVVLDAFLNKFAIDLYFRDKKKLIIENVYKDETEVLVYNHRDTFINALEHHARTKADTEIVSCSFGTLKEMYTVRQILQEHNLNVVTIDGKTTEEVKKLLSEYFQKEKTNYDVVLFSPTITVGVSIKNDINHHFHYDVGKSVDPISSVQMTKRSRLAKAIHIYLDGIDKLPGSTSLDVLNQNTIDNLEKVNAGLINYDTLSISELGKFNNKFVAHKHFYEGNHKDIVLFLLSKQFKTIKFVEEHIKHRNFDSKQKEIIKLMSVQYIKPNRPLDIEDYDDSYLKKNLSNEELSYQTSLMIKNMYGFKDHLVDLVAREYFDNKSILRHIDNFKFFVTKSISERKEYVQEQVMSDLRNAVVQDERITDFTKLSQIDFQLQEYYTKKEVQQMMFRNLTLYECLGLIGYKKKNGGMMLSSLMKTINSVLQNTTTKRKVING